VKADPGVDWAGWLRRWEAQQSSGLPEREARFEVIVNVVRHLVGDAPRVVDLGSGPGSLASRLLDALPGARVVAVDADPLLLAIGRRALGDRDGHLQWLDADLRGDAWVEAAAAEGPVDAAVSTTALHWLSPADQVHLLASVATLIRPGGVFVNGDHLTFDRGQARIAAATRALQDESVNRHVHAHPAETWLEWWHAVEADPGLADLAAERRSRWGGHPDHHDLGEGRFMEAALERAGFAEVGTVWQRYEDRVLVAIR
jgi:SAM-dependent methyltransferase